MGAYVGIPVRNPDDITEAERDKLYELFKKRFVGMTEIQADATLRLDECASDFINQHENADPFKVRKAFMNILDDIHATDRVGDFIDYYAAKERQRGVVVRQVCWQVLHCRTRDELKRFYFANGAIEPLMKRFKLTTREYDVIAAKCLEKGADPRTGCFQYALEAAAKGKNKRVFSKLMGIAIKAGHYESCEKVAAARKRVLTMRELKQLAKVILESKIGKEHTHWYDLLFIEHPELKLGTAVVDALFYVFWPRRKLTDRDINRDWWVLNDILRYAEKFNRPLTYEEKRLLRDRLWLEHHEGCKKKALEIAQELVGANPVDGDRLRAMKEDQFYEHLHKSEFDQAATLAQELGIEMTSRELYGQKHGQMRPDDKKRLHDELVNKLVEEVGKPSDPALVSEAENRTIH